MKLFVAVKLSEAALDRLVEIQKRYLNHPGIKTEPRDKMHLTLLYIGETEQYQKIANVLNDITFASFEIGIDSVGMFENRNTIYWVGIQNSPDLYELSKAVSDSIKPVIPNLNYRFYPHITIARGKRKVATEFIGHPVAVNIKEFVLFESREGAYIPLNIY